jgi:hypothetical protein
MTWGGAPKAMLKLAKSLSLVRNVNPCVLVYSQIIASGVLPSPTELT